MLRVNCIVTARKGDMDIKYGIVAYTLEGPKDKPVIAILHFCGYENPPTQQQIDGLAEELNTDPEFNLVGRIGVDVLLTEASDAMVREMARQMKDI